MRQLRAPGGSTTSGEWRCVGVWAADPLSTAALHNAVRAATGVEVCEPDDLGPGDVLVVAADRNGRARAHVEEAATKLSVVWIAWGSTLPEHPRLWVLPRAQFGGEGLLNSLRQAMHPVQGSAGAVDGSSGATGGADDDVAHALTDRQVQVLRLLAQGHDTAGIAATLFYSERTVKNVIHHVVQNLQVRNRAQAVAVAVRAGLV